MEEIGRTLEFLDTFFLDIKLRSIRIKINKVWIAFSVRMRGE